ncbi:unnamed protein product [Leptosia nina]|uniref:Uncharacterized protein n=1 Tax=Leptosia nina TaxID=320188 RepID=A0AAV1J5X3_9NEOP
MKDFYRFERVASPEFRLGVAREAADAPRWWAATAALRARRALWRRGMSSARLARPARPPWRRPRPHNAPTPSPRRPSTSPRTATIAPICSGGSSARATAAKVRACASYVDTREARPVMQPGRHPSPITASVTQDPGCSHLPTETFAFHLPDTAWPPSRVPPAAPVSESAEKDVGENCEISIGLFCMRFFSKRRGAVGGDVHPTRRVAYCLVSHH